MHDGMSVVVVAVSTGFELFNSACSLSIGIITTALNCRLCAYLWYY